MSINDTILNLEDSIQLLSKIADDFQYLCYINTKGISPNRHYNITISSNNRFIERRMRRSALNKLKPITKLAFDARFVDQENDRNPRSNLQYWMRSDPYIDQQTQDKLNHLVKLFNAVKIIKNNLGTSPEYHNSYAKTLFDNLERILKIKQIDKDIFAPQISYLEQLLYVRYRLDFNLIDALNENELVNIILQKDESLLKRGVHNLNTNIIKTTERSNDGIIINGDGSNQDILNSIFGNVRKHGEKSVERVITITIREQVQE